MSDPINTFDPVEITLKTGESYEVLGITIKMISAGTKRKVGGGSALVATLEVSNKHNNENLNLNSLNDFTSKKDWDGITINLLNGDNGTVDLKIIPK